MQLRGESTTTLYPLDAYNDQQQHDDLSSALKSQRHQANGFRQRCFRRRTPPDGTIVTIVTSSDAILDPIVTISHRMCAASRNFRISTPKKRFMNHQHGVPPAVSLPVSCSNRNGTRQTSPGTRTIPHSRLIPRYLDRRNRLPSPDLDARETR
jgi:hypothetical protein